MLVTRGYNGAVRNAEVPVAERSEVELPDGVRLHVETTGPADAPVTVILLHGWCLDRRTWHRQVSGLAEALGGPDNARFIAYDARGHGRSSSTRLGSATLGQLGDDLAEVLRQLAPEGPVVLAGHSMGGMTIMEYAHQHAEEFAARIAGLVFVATTAEGATHTRYGLPPHFARLMRAAETAGAGVLARCGAWHPHRAVLPALRPGLRWLLFGDGYEPSDLRLTMSSVGRASLRSIGGFRESIGAQQRLETLAALGDVPAAVLVGDRDRLTPPPCAESIAEALPGTELTVCPGAGHMLMLERPAEVTAALAAVIARAADSTPDERSERCDRARAHQQQQEQDPDRQGYGRAA
jgi:pimeloyl-ACP methyl ester carboxylesterase